LSAIQALRNPARQRGPVDSGNLHAGARRGQALHPLGVAGGLVESRQIDEDQRIDERPAHDHVCQLEQGIGASLARLARGDGQVDQPLVAEQRDILCCANERRPVAARVQGQAHALAVA
jgi:hypothetical protein